MMEPSSYLQTGLAFLYKALEKGSLTAVNYGSRIGDSGSAFRWGEHGIDNYAIQMASLAH
jgi:hypothetical protein